MKKHLTFIIKLALTLGILGWIFHKIDFQKFQLSIKNADWQILIWAILLYFISSFINTYKWSLLLNSHSITHPYRRLVNYNFIGMFCNFFMPGMVGGDVQKCYAVYRDESLDLKDKLPRGRLTQIISSVMMARLTGVVAMIWQANIAYFFVFRKLPFYQGITDSFIIFLLPKLLLLMLLGTILLFTVPLFFKFDIQHSDRKPNIFIKVLNSVKHMGMVIKGYILNFKMFVYVMIISLFFQALMNLINALIGYSLHLNVPLSYYFIAVPLITLCTAVPISLSGFGIREGSYIYFLRFVGVTPAEGVLLSLTSVFVTAITSATGGILLFREGFLIQREKPSEDEIDAHSET